METFIWGNRSWGPGDKARFAKWLQARGLNYNTWARNHPGVAARVFGKTIPTAGGTSKSLIDIASSRADDLLAADLAKNDAERAKAQESSQHLMENAKGMYAALAGLLGGIGPATQQTYEGAANATTNMARGFADAQEAIQSGEASDLNSFLAKTGAPQEQIAQVMQKVGGSDVGDVLYGTTGYLPGSTLAREGAAFTSAANRLPAEAATGGMEKIKQLLSEALSNNKSFDDNAAQINAGRPSLVQKIMDDILDQQRQDRSLAIQEGYLGNTIRNTGAQITGYDPVTGQPTYETVADAAKTAGEKKADQRAAAKEREDAFAKARGQMFQTAKTFRKEMSLAEKIKWAKAHNTSLANAPNFRTTSYADAKKTMFDMYKDLLRYASRSGKAALKKRLNQMIDEALASVGIRPEKPGRPTRTAPLGSGFTELGKGDRG